MDGHYVSRSRDQTDMPCGRQSSVGNGQAGSKLASRKDRRVRIELQDAVGDWRQIDIGDLPTASREKRPAHCTDELKLGSLL
jgi:hypothetical protein